jgi:flagellar hook-basal body complex protein FliE
MAVDPTSAMRAYAAAARTASSVGGEGEGDAFAGMLQNAISSYAQAGKSAEGAAMASAVGKADIVDVATAIAAAEVSLETMMTVRDQVINAYQEIMRMPI